MYLRGNRRCAPLLCPGEPYNGLNACNRLLLSIISPCITGTLLAKRSERGIFKKTCQTCSKRETRGGEKSKRLLPVHFCGSPARLRPQVSTDDGDVKRTCGKSKICSVKV